MFEEQVRKLARCGFAILWSDGRMLVNVERKKKVNKDWDKEIIKRE